MKRFAAFFMAAMVLNACTSVADGNVIEDDESSGSAKLSSSAKASSSSTGGVAESSSLATDPVSSAGTDSASLLSKYTDWVKVPATTLKRSSITYSVDPFEIGRTEVTQSLYREIMGSVPEMVKTGDDIPVANVNWFDAVLFCNELSKKVGLDTAYVYDSVEESRYLSNLSIDYSVESVRLPTEMEWEAAYRAGTTTTYYWGTDKASDYAYYIQTIGPTKVAQFKPNAYGLYDMGGNVAEWTNDWFGGKPAKSQINYIGAESGTAKVTRGGGWSDVAKVIAADTSVKKDPLYLSDKQGLRLVHSAGF